MATYVNNLRLTELATGEGSGTWGTTTNTSLELIGEALGYNTQDCFSSDADATTTVADGATDPARAFYFKVTSSATLTATRTLTIAPNTVSRVMFIENATTGSQSITISQGSGANVTIATGRTAVVYLDGAGATAAVVDAMANVDPGVTDTLAEVLAAGNTSGGTGLTMSSGDDLTLTGASYNAVWDSSDSALEFADNAKAVFGAGSDLLIYHDGSNSYISETGTGSLRIRSNQTRLEAPDSQNMVIVTEDAGVQAFYNGTERLTVTNTGIDVTGTAVTDGVTVDGVLGFVANASFPTTGLVLYTNNYLYQRGGSSGIIFSDASGTNEISRFTPATVTFNEDSNDQDFRVESNGNTHMIFVDGAGDHVNIGTSTDLTGVLNVDGNVGLSGAGTGSRYVALLAETNTYAGSLIMQAGGGSAAYGGSIVMYGHSHASNGGDVVLGISAGSGGQFRVHNNGVDTGADRLTIGENGDFVTFPAANNAAVFNQAGVDADFRVESDSNTHALFVDGGNSNVLIGTSTVAYAGTLLNIGTTSDTQNGVQIQTSTTGNGYILFGDGSGADAYRGQIQYEHTSDKLTLRSGGAIRQQLSGTETVFNESSTDTDFRVESDNNSFMLFLDAGNDSVNIGDSDGSLATLQVRGEVGGSIFRLFSGTSYQGLKFDGTAYIGNGTVEILPVTIPGSGTANQYTYFNSVTSGGTTNHHVLVKNSFQVQDGGAVFNQDGNDNDFRVESDTDAGLFFVDASTSRVGIGTQSPEALLDVRGSAHIQSSQDGDVQLRIENSNTGASSVAQLYLDGQGNNFYIKNYGDGTSTPNLTDLRSTAGSSEFAFSPSSTETMRIKQSFVGINTDAPAVELDIARVSNSYQLRVGSTLGNGKAMVFADIASTPSKYNFLVGSQYNHDNTWEVTPSTAVGGYTFSYSAITVDPSGFVTINEDSRSRDFRVESDSNANAFVLDGTNGNIGMGGNSNVPLNIFRDGAGNTELLRLTNNNTNNHNFYVFVNDDDNYVRFGSTGDNGGNFAILDSTNTNDTIRLFTGGGAVFNEQGGSNATTCDFRVESDSQDHMLFVDASGNRVIIGRNLGSATLEIYEASNKDEADAHFRITGSGYSGNHWLDGAAYYIGQNSTSRSLRFYSGAETAGAQLSNGATSFTTFSDERLKYDVEPIENALESLSGLRTVKYRLEGVDSPSDKKKLGVIAQDLVGVHDEVLDPMVRSDDDTEYMGVRYTELVPVLIKAVQEQTEIINDLRARVAQLESN